MQIGELQIAEQADIGVEVQPVPIARNRRLIADRLELEVERAILLVEPGVLARHIDARVHVHDAGVAVDDDVVALVQHLGDVPDADDGRDLERLGENRRVRRHAAAREHDALQALMLHRREVGERELVGDEDHVAIEAT